MNLPWLVSVLQRRLEAAVARQGDSKNHLREALTAAVLQFRATHHGRPSTADIRKLLPAEYANVALSTIVNAISCYYGLRKFDQQIHDGFQLRAASPPAVNRASAPRMPTLLTMLRQVVRDLSPAGGTLEQIATRMDATLRSYGCDPAVLTLDIAGDLEKMQNVAKLGDIYYIQSAVEEESRKKIRTRLPRQSDD